jgi:hypothetical protein
VYDIRDRHSQNDQKKQEIRVCSRLNGFGSGDGKKEGIQGVLDRSLSLLWRNRERAGAVGAYRSYPFPDLTELLDPVVRFFYAGSLRTPVKSVQ